jgi:PAS domain S-box-containing protein
MTEPIRVLHVDDDENFARMTATFLEREKTHWTVETAASASEALDVLERTRVDCLISDYQMDDANGLELLEDVKTRYPDLPFVLFTGKGSEEIASEAVARGVTDYLQKETSADQFEVLANRVENAIETTRAQRSLERERDRREALFDNATDPIVEAVFEDERARILDVNPAFESVFGYDAESLRGAVAGDVLVPDREDAVAKHRSLLDRLRAGEDVEATVKRRTAEGMRDFLVHAASYDAGQRADPSGYAWYIDITEQKRRERTLQHLYEATRDLLLADDPVAAAETAAVSLQKSFDFPYVGIRLRRGDELPMVAYATERSDLDTRPPAYGVEEGFVGDAFQRGESVVHDHFDDVETSFDYGPVESVLIVPVDDHGLVSIGATEPDAFDEYDRELARVFAANLTAVLDSID